MMIDVVSSRSSLNQLYVPAQQRGNLSVVNITYTDLIIIKPYSIILSSFNNNDPAEKKQILHLNIHMVASYPLHKITPLKINVAKTLN